ncbi:adenosylcobinamide amidohydrolase [Plantactinospora endophytica]|uniref:Adenosylcobinamide amidohydrolase n=1 Tax=Plantactinospora endophytica TaxID=673535 RepID=A0ABQ4DRW0_9ACTN|nr:adenosylcobinamide amidohydrolase [Plantactinospora endophytica]GIG85198.1 adenosylcobinamide amidohydrolase [Plantactinospora endophytica]
MPVEPLLTHRPEDGRDVPLLVWRLDRPALAISSGPLGGGIGVRHWVVNATVPMSYRRDDPDAHLGELADHLGLRGPGIGLLTGVDVAEVVIADDAGVRVWATVGLGAPIWAAADPNPAPNQAPNPAGPAHLTGPAHPIRRAHPIGPAHPVGPAYPVGTVNIVALLPERLADAALVNAVATVTEAKAQALRDLGLPATGTATDAVAVLCPPDGPAAPYGGPRSHWGARLARAAHRAVRDGGARPTVPWSRR